MPFNVSEFRANLQRDGARPNLFEVTMPFPAFAVPGNAQQKLTFMCKTSQLPGSTLGAFPVYYFGREVKLAGNRTFPDWTITVINDEDFIVRNAFERWMNGMNSHGFNRRAATAQTNTGYTVDASVIQYGKDGGKIKNVRLIGAFPNDVSPIDLDWGSNDTIEEFTVTLSYQWWEDARNGIV